MFLVLVLLSILLISVQSSQVVTYQRMCSGRRRVYKCSDFIQKERTYVQKVQDRLTREGKDGAYIDEYLKKNPYNGDGACKFHVAANVSATSRVLVSKTSVWIHDIELCTSKPRSKVDMILQHPSFRQVCETNGNRAKSSQMGDATPASESVAAMYRAQRKLVLVPHSSVLESIVILCK